MIKDIFTAIYYQNSVSDWLMALLIILGFVLAGKVLYWLSTKFLKVISRKTRSKLDDIIVDMIEEPIVFAMIIFGIWVAFQRLTFTDAISLWVGNVFQVLIILNIAWLLTRLFDSLVEEYLVPLSDKTETDLDDQLLPILRKGMKVIIWIVAVIVALNNAGYNVGALLAGLGIGGIAFAMAAKDTITNIFGGVTIFTDKPFKLRDRIKILGFDGTVEEIGLRSTRVRTLAGRIVTIPNSKFTDSAVENISSEPKRKIVLNLGLSCDTAPKKITLAMGILRKIIEKADGTTEDMAIGFNGFGDFTYNVLVVYYIKKGSDILGTQTAINLEILKQFNKNKIVMPYPSQTIYTKKG